MGRYKKEGLKQGVTEEQIEEMNKKYPFFEGDGEACYSRFPILSYERLNMSISSFFEPLCFGCAWEETESICRAS